MLNQVQHDISLLSLCDGTGKFLETVFEFFGEFLENFFALNVEFGECVLLNLVEFDCVFCVVNHGIGKIYKIAEFAVF